MRLFYISFLGLLTVSPVAYGWTDEEVAAVTCSVIGATRNMDAAIRIEKVNETRKELGKSPYLYGDAFIQESLLYDVCPDLVLDDSWATKLNAAKERVEAAVAEERRQREAPREAEERRQREAREAREARERQKADAKRAERRKKLEEEGFTCPSTAEERTNLITMALDQGNTALYTKVVKCGKP